MPIYTSRDEAGNIIRQNFDSAPMAMTEGGYVPDTSWTPEAAPAAQPISGGGSYTAPQYNAYQPAATDAGAASFGGGSGEQYSSPQGDFTMVGAITDPKGLGNGTVYQGPDGKFYLNGQPLNATAEQIQADIAGGKEAQRQNLAKQDNTSIFQQFAQSPGVGLALGGIGVGSAISGALGAAAAPAVSDAYGAGETLLGGSSSAGGLEGLASGAAGGSAADIAAAQAAFNGGVTAEDAAQLASQGGNAAPAAAPEAAPAAPAYTPDPSQYTDAPTTAPTPEAPAPYTPDPSQYTDAPTPTPDPSQSLLSQAAAKLGVDVTTLPGLAKLIGYGATAAGALGLAKQVLWLGGATASSPYVNPNHPVATAKAPAPTYGAGQASTLLGGGSNSAGAAPGAALWMPNIQPIGQGQAQQSQLTGTPQGAPMFSAVPGQAQYQQLQDPGLYPGLPPAGPYGATLLGQPATAPAAVR